MQLLTRNFNLNGVIMAVHSNQKPWLEELTKSISAPPAADDSRADLEVELLEMENHEIEALCPLPDEEYKLDEAGLILDQLISIKSYQREKETWQDIQGYARTLVDHKNGRCSIYRRRQRTVVNPFYANIFFVLGLMGRLMTCRGFNAIHASCTEVNGRGVIITGPGGRGKSTAGYALARQGHPFLNDERILLKLADSYRACSISDIFKLRKAAIDRFFPEPTLAKPIYLPSHDEFCYKAADIPGMRMAVECSAEILLILNQVNQPGSNARSINPARAVGELFPVTLNPRSRAGKIEKFDFLTDFLQQVTCYQIDFGYDMDKL